MNRRIFLKTSAAASVLTMIPLRLSAKPDPKNLRSVELYDRGQWKPGTWAGLKKGDIFRLRDPDGTLVNEGDLNEILVVADGGVSACAPPAFWVVDADPFTTITMDHHLASRVKVMKDGQQVGFVQSLDLRTHTMRRVAPSLGEVFGDTFDYIKLGPEPGTPEHVSGTVSFTGSSPSRLDSTSPSDSRFEPPEGSTSSRSSPWPTTGVERGRPTTRRRREAPRKKGST